MICAVLGTLLLIKSVSLEYRSVQYGKFPVRNTEHDSTPYKTYSYSDVSSGHGTLNEFVKGSVNEPWNNDYGYDLKKYDSYLEPYSNKDYPFYPTTFSRPTIKHSSYPMDEARMDYELSRRNSEAEYERMKSLMFYDIPEDATNDSHEFMTTYSVDNEDVRTSPRNYYTFWPYFQYDKKIDGGESNVRSTRGGVIPVYEEYYVDTINPKFGNTVKGEPFYSSISKGYNDKDNEDGLEFTEFDKWAREFDYKPQSDNFMNSKEVYNYDNNKQLHSLNFQPKNEIFPENGSSKTHKFSSGAKGEKQIANNKSQFKDSGTKNDAAKFYKDRFSNKYGVEDQNKNSKYLLKTNQDAGEKRKGFRRVYHKDEYQEDNEFYDTKNKKAKSEETGGSHNRFGGSDAFLQSSAKAAISDGIKAFDNTGNNESESFDNKNEGYEIDDVQKTFTDSWKGY